MARYEIMYWKEFPAQVKASDDDGTSVNAMLPERFSEAIDAAAMAEGSTDSLDYLNGWQWGPALQRAGSAQEVVDIIVTELDEAYPKDRLRKMILERKAD